MPYEGLPEERWPEMEKCVVAVMAGDSSLSKESAIAICHESVSENKAKQQSEWRDPFFRAITSWKFSEDQPRDVSGRFGEGGGASDGGDGGGRDGGGGSDGGADSAKADEAMSGFADSYQNANVEHGIVIQPDGTEIELQPGSSGMIAMSPSEAPPGSIQIHNHPDPGTFSPQDVRATLSGGMAEMRVVGSDGKRYVLRNPGWAKPPSNARITTLVAKINNTAMEHARSVVGEGGPGFRDAMEDSLREQYSGGALSKVGLEYEEQ